MTIAALNDGHTIEVEIRDGVPDDEGVSIPCVVLWLALYGSANQTYGAVLDAAKARQLAAELVRLADEISPEG